MSDKSFELVSREVAEEVLEAASSNADAVEHLLILCGCATFRYGESVYLILTPKDGDLLRDSHVVHITDAKMLEEIGAETVRCGNPARKPLGRFLKAEQMEDSNIFRTLVASIEESMRIRGTNGPINPNFFDAEPAPESDEANANIPQEVSDALVKWFSDDGGVMALEVKRTPNGLEIEVSRLQRQPNPFGMMRIGGLGDLLQALGARGEGNPRKPQNFGSFAEFLAAQGHKIKGDGDGNLDETEQNFSAASTDDGEEE